MSGNNQKTNIAEITRPIIDDEQEIRTLISKIKEGDTTALQHFFELYSQDIYNFPIRVFNFNEDDAGDFFLFAFERLRDGRRMASFAGGSKFRTWLYAVLRNLVIDWLRTKKDIEFISVERIEKEEERPSAEAILTESENIHEILVHKLDQLTPLHKIIFKLVYVYYIDLSVSEIKFLQKEYRLSIGKIADFVSKIRSELVDKEEDNLRKEDSLTHTYLSLYRLKEKRDRLLNDKSKDQPTVDREREQLDSAIDKKYATRNRLLERKRKGLLVARAPYRSVAAFLGVSEGSISVYMSKVIAFLTNDVDLKKFF